MDISSPTVGSTFATVATLALASTPPGPGLIFYVRILGFFGHLGLHFGTFLGVFWAA